MTISANTQVAILEILNRNGNPYNKFAAAMAAGNWEDASGGDCARQAENLIQSLIKSDTTEFTAPLMIAIGENVKAVTGNFKSWSHQMCHTFEGYNHFDGFEKKDLVLHHSPEQARSVLDNPALHAGAALIVNEAVERSLKYKGLENTGRILAPIALYNLIAIACNGLQHDFAYRPDRLADPAFVSLAANDDEACFSTGFADADKMPRAFLQAETPADFLKTVIGSRVKLGESLYTRLQPVLRELFNDEELEKYLIETKAFETDIGRKILQNCEGRYGEGVFVDVDNTLIIDGKLNADVAALVVALQRDNKKVVVFTGDETGKKQEELARLGLSVEVQAKSDFRGYALQTLIDDTEEGQGFVALSYKTPEEISAEINAPVREGYNNYCCDLTTKKILDIKSSLTSPKSLKVAAQEVFPATKGTGLPETPTKQGFFQKLKFW